MMGSSPVLFGILIAIVAIATDAQDVPNEENDEYITIPGVKKVLYDYTNRLVIYQFFNERKNAFDHCFAREMEDGETYNAYEQDDAADDQEDLFEEWRSTYRQVNRGRISDSAKEMCADRMIYILRKYKNSGIQPMRNNYMPCRWSRPERRCNGYPSWQRHENWCKPIRICM